MDECTDKKPNPVPCDGCCADHPACCNFDSSYHHPVSVAAPHVVHAAPAVEPESIHLTGDAADRMTEPEREAVREKIRRERAVEPEQPTCLACGIEAQPLNHVCGKTTKPCPDCPGDGVVRSAIAGVWCDCVELVAPRVQPDLSDLDAVIRQAKEVERARIVTIIEAIHPRDIIDRDDLLAMIEGGQSDA